MSVSRAIQVAAICFYALAAVVVGGDVHAENACLPAPDGLVAWWPADGDAKDIEGGHDGDMINGVGFVPGIVDLAFDFDGTIPTFVEVQDSRNFDFGTSPMTIEGWILAPTGSGFRAIIGKEKIGHPAYSFGMRLAGTTADGTLDGQVQFFAGCGSGSPCGFNNTKPAVSPLQRDDAQFHHVAGLRRPDGTFELFVDGVMVDSRLTVSPPETVNSESTLVIGAQVRYSNGAVAFPFDGLVDELSIYDRDLTPSEIAAIFGAGSAGKCKDQDGDGFRPPDDCDETSASVNPNGLELPGNFIDENCDGDLGRCDPCFPWKNHGQYVRCVAHDVLDLVNTGALSEEEGDALVSAAARSEIGKRGHVAPECQ